jgi:hypothetical protein
MSGQDATPGEMPGFPFTGRPGSELDELLDMILNGQSLPPDAPGEIHDLAETLAGLDGPGEPDELAGEAAVVRFALARKVSPAGVSPARPARQKPPRRTVPRSTRVAAALVVAAIPLSGTAAAYTGVLPGPVQDFAHHVIHAPPAHRPGHPRQYPAGDTPGHGNAVAPTGSQPASPEPAKPKGTPKPAKPPKPRPSPKPKSPKQTAPKQTAPATVTAKAQPPTGPTSPATAIPKHEHKRYKDKTRHSG